MKRSQELHVLSGTLKSDLSCTKQVIKWLGTRSVNASLTRRACPPPQASTSESHWPKSSRRRFLRLISLREERFLLGVERSFRVSLSARPACQHKGDFVNEVGNVVGHVEGLGCASRIVDLAKAH